MLMKIRLSAAALFAAPAVLLITIIAAPSADAGSPDVRGRYVQSAGYDAHTVSTARQYAPAAFSGGFDRADSGLYTLAAFIEAEAGGEPYICMVSVGAVAVNRAAAPGYPDSLLSVVLGMCGESSRFFTSSPPGRRALHAARDAMCGIDPTGGALSFEKDAAVTDGLCVGSFSFSPP